MADTVLKLVCSVPSIDLTLDGFSNTFIFGSSVGGTSPSADALNLAPLVKNFYNTVPPSASVFLSSYYSPSLQAGTNVAQIKCYDITAHLDGTPAGGPIATYSFNWSAPGSPGTGVPEGVAAALSFQSPYGADPEYGPGTPPSTRPRASHRGKVYLGPLSNASAFTLDSSTNRTKLNSSFMNTALQALGKLATDALAAAGNYYLSQWSKKHGIVLPLSNAWIDDRPDYQRRRSDQSTTRSTLPVAGLMSLEGALSPYPVWGPGTSSRLITPV